jgi:hypothetical protein
MAGSKEGKRGKKKRRVGMTRYWGKEKRWIIVALEGSERKRGGSREETV